MGKFNALEECMTPLEIVGAFALSLAAAKALAALFTPTRDTIKISVATEQISLAVREAFRGGMLCAADMVTHSGHESLAGEIRQVARDTLNREAGTDD